MRKTLLLVLITLIPLTLGLSACASLATRTPGPDQIAVVATTSILADVVKQVGGERVFITTLVPPGSSEHEYQATPRDVAAVSDAALVFEIGLDLEQFMKVISQNSAPTVKPVIVSNGIVTRQFTSNGGGEQYSADPHVWMDPTNVIVWVNNIQAALSTYDPAHKDIYAANATAYITQLQALDQWIVEQVKNIPPAKRLIVTDHMLFGYFAARYEFTVVGALIPSYSSVAEPSARDIANLEDAIRNYGVKVILVGDNVNSTLGNRVADDTGIRLVQFYTGSLSAPDGPAATYLAYMRFNVNTIVKALS